MTSPLRFPCNVSCKETCPNTLFFDYKSSKWTSDSNLYNFTYGINVSQLVDLFWERVDQAFRHYTNKPIVFNGEELHTEKDIRSLLQTNCENCSNLIAALLSSVETKNNEFLIKNSLKFNDVQNIITRDLEKKEKNLNIHETKKSHFNLDDNLNPEQDEKQVFLGKILFTTEGAELQHPETMDYVRVTILNVFFDSWKTNNAEYRFHKDMLTKPLNRFDETNLGGALITIIINKKSIKIEIHSSSGDFGKVQCQSKLRSHISAFFQKEFGNLGFTSVETCMRNLKQ